jgi:hypothetical protein
VDCSFVPLESCGKIEHHCTVQYTLLYTTLPRSRIKRYMGVGGGKRDKNLAEGGRKEKATCL